MAKAQECQAAGAAASGIRKLVSKKEENYISHFTKYQIPPAIATTSNNTNNPAPNIANLNLRYLPSSGGDSEPCGKYGGGLSVAIAFDPCYFLQTS